MGQDYDYRKDELLELLWHLEESHGLNLESLRQHDPDKVFEKSLPEFSKKGYLEINGGEIALSEQGREKAKGIVRRHRLAERLMVDVLGHRVEDTEMAACEFEHILAPGIVESICILLGHPKQCPHGSPIPEGKCCVEAKKSIESVVEQLSEMKAGAAAKVAFISTRDNERMHKLLSIGFTPGTEIKLLQTSPALVIEINRNQVALERTVGEEIKVWKGIEEG